MHSLNEKVFNYSTTQYQPLPMFKQIITDIMTETGWRTDSGVTIDDYVLGNYFTLWFDENDDNTSELIGLQFKMLNNSNYSFLIRPLVKTVVPYTEVYVSYQRNIRMTIHRSINETVTFLDFNNNAGWDSILDSGTNPNTESNCYMMGHSYVVAKNVLGKYTIFNSTYEASSRYSYYPQYCARGRLLVTTNDASNNAFFNFPCLNNNYNYSICQAPDFYNYSYFSELYNVISMGAPSQYNTLVKFDGDNIYRIALMNHFTNGAALAFPVADPVS